MGERLFCGHVAIQCGGRPRACGDAPPPALLGQPMAKSRRVTSSSLAKIDITSFNSPLQWCAYIS
jgi:hypothetical protein